MSSSAVMAPSGAELAKITGPRLMALLLNWGAYGVLCAQVYLYTIAFPKDRPRLKALVYGVMVLESIQTVMETKTDFNIFVYGFLEPSSLDEIGILWFSVPILSGIVTLLSQSFYAYRILILGKSLKIVKYLVLLIALLAFAQIIGSVAVGLEMRHARSFSKFNGSKVKISVGFWNGGGAFCDIIIAFCMSFILSSSTHRGMRQTQKIVQKIIRLTIGTGSLTALIAILNFILVIPPDLPLYYQTTAAILSKIYANSMLVVLNSRMQPTSHAQFGTGQVETRWDCSRPIEFASEPIDSMYESPTR